METKTIQLEYDGQSVTIHYYVGEKYISKPVKISPVPKHLKLLLEKFPNVDLSAKGAKDQADPAAVKEQSKPSEGGLEPSQDKAKYSDNSGGGHLNEEK